MIEITNIQVEKELSKERPSSDYIGALVKQFESGNRGCLALGCCGNDYGLSCGSYQLTLRWGNCINFLKKYFPAESKKLYFNLNKKDLPVKVWPGKDYCSSPDHVKKIWVECYNKVGEAKFFHYEHAHIQNQYYVTLLNKLQNVFDPNKHSRMAQECLWSWAIHKGVNGAYKCFQEAIGSKNPQTMDASELLDLLYDKRFSVDSFPRYKKGEKNSEREKLRKYCNKKPLDMKIS